MDIECAHCGNKQLTQVPGVWSPTPMSDGKVMQGAGPAVPVVLVGCPQCGYLQMFSTQVVKPQEWPAGGPTRE